MSLAEIRSKIWERVRYQCTSTRCYNCAHASDWSTPTEGDAGQKGKCNVLAGLTFDILSYGICKLHSAFGGGNLKHG